MLYTLHRGGSPLVISVPHAGTIIPSDIAGELTSIGRDCVDTDWHVDRLYDFAASLGATVLVATHSRSVVDLNRGPDGARLYPGQAETGICPTESFAGEALYASAGPDEAERCTRIARYWQPYHDALAGELARVRGMHGFARLLDGHSIATEVPRLFAGRLPDLNFGTNDGRSASEALVTRVLAAAAAGGFSMVRDGRFKGGYITRHYGDPGAGPGSGIDAIQLELALSAYVDEGSPRVFDPVRAAALVGVLQRIVRELLRA